MASSPESITSASHATHSSPSRLENALLFLTSNTAVARCYGCPANSSAQSKLRTNSCLWLPLSPDFPVSASRVIPPLPSEVSGPSPITFVLLHPSPLGITSFRFLSVFLSPQLQAKKRVRRTANDISATLGTYYMQSRG